MARRRWAARPAVAAEEASVPPWRIGHRAASAAAVAAALWAFVAAAAAAAAPAASAALAGDAVRGSALYARCLACHALAYDRVGPHHCGLIGRRAGSVAGFAYSAAMRQADLTWDVATLDRFLAAPAKVVPGTSMTYDGVADPRERADLIAYLASASRSADCPAPAKPPPPASKPAVTPALTPASKPAQTPPAH